MNTDKIINGGVKRVVVREVQDPDFVTITIEDEEGMGEVLARTTKRKNDKPVPVMVEEYLYNFYLMGPTWFWSTPRFGVWEGQFAHMKNAKCSDGFGWEAKKNV